MSETGLTERRAATTKAAMTRMWRAAPIGALLWTASCISVSAPDKPIVINLNINVTQEVVYRLNGEAKALIKENPGIF